MSKFEEKIRKRWERFESRGKEYSIVSDCHPFSVITNRGYKGIIDNNGVIYVPPVYDDIMVFPSFNLASVSIDGLHAVVDATTGELLTDFNYDRLECSLSDHTIVLHKGELKGVFNVATRSVVHEPRFVDINSSVYSRFSWMYSPKDGYYMEDISTGKSVYLGNDIDMCFDETYGHIFILKENKIRMITENGTEDSIEYRKLLSSIGGRLSLYNSSRGIGVIADIYGKIL